MTRTLDPLSKIQFYGGQSKKDALRQGATLCAISDLPSLEQMESALRNKGLATRYQWQHVWGPIKVSNSLLSIFYHPTQNLYTLVIKGPKMTFSSSFVEDWYEKFAISEMLPPSAFPLKGAKVSKLAFLEAEALLSAGNGIQTLKDFYIDHILAHKAQLWVAGHGMGGAISGLVALALQQLCYRKNPSMKNKVLPMTFGAPAVGNFLFVSYFNEVFPYALRTHNSLDAVPYAWNGLDKIPHLYPKGPNCPEILSLGIKYILEKFAENKQHHYLQNASQGVKLEGSPGGNLDFLQELGVQHSLNNYLKLLGGKPV